MNQLKINNKYDKLNILHKCKHRIENLRNKMGSESSKEVGGNGGIKKLERLLFGDRWTRERKRRRFAPSGKLLNQTRFFAALQN